MKRFCLLLSFLLFSASTFSQNKGKIAQLQKELSDIRLSDTARINRYLAISNAYIEVQKDSALVYANKAELKALQIIDDQKVADALYLEAKIYYYSNDYPNAKLYQFKSLNKARKIKDKHLMSKNYNLLGAMNFNEGKYESANNYYRQKLALSIELKDTTSIIETYYNMSLIYNQQGHYTKAIDHNYKALRIAEKSNDSSSIIYSSEGLGIAYYSLKDFKNAMIYTQKAKRYAIALKDDYSLAGIFIDEGNIYAASFQLDSAIVLYDQALALARKIDDDFHYSIALTCIAIPYQKKKDYNKALDYATEAEQISTKINRKGGLALCYNIFFECYFELENYPLALKYAKLSESVAHELGGKADLITAYHNLYLIHEKTGNNDQAFFYLKKYIAIEKEINGSTQQIEIAKQELNNEKARQEQAHMQEKELAKAEFEKQKMIKNIILIASGILLILFIFLLRNYRQKQKANIEISEQKKTIEHKNKDILDSINYSKRIQQAILTPIEEVKKLLPDSFILYKPKDIVSGDFYFIEPIEASDGNEWLAVAMADCTGHGVPGAFMSIIGYNFLKQSLKEKSINEPGAGLDFVSKEFYTLLRSHQKEGSIRDGMDVAFCAINKTKNLMSYSGANNPLWIISKRKAIRTVDNEPLKMVRESGDYFLYEIKAVKQHVGYNENRRPFITHTIHLEAGDLVYLFTDGYADQFGGPLGKKFKYNQMAAILLDNASASMETQHAHLEEAFTNWIGELEQVDDVSVLGIRI